MNGRNDIIRPGQVKRQRKGALTSASEAMDWNLKKTQEEINKGIGGSGNSEGCTPKIVTLYGGGNVVSGTEYYSFDIVENINPEAAGSFVAKEDVDYILSHPEALVIIKPNGASTKPTNLCIVSALHTTDGNNIPFTELYQLVGEEGEEVYYQVAEEDDKLYLGFTEWLKYNAHVK